MESTEKKIQSDCFVWLWNYMPETRGLLCYNLANSKNKVDGAQNKAMGLIAGRSDMVLYWKSIAYMFEFKTEIGKQSSTQKEWQKTIENQGFKYYIVRNLIEFKEILKTIL